MLLRLIFIVFFSSGFLSVKCQEKPKKAFVLFEEAEDAYNGGKYETALEILDQCLRTSPGHFEAYSLRGSVKEILKDTQGALTDYSIYLENVPHHMEVRMSRAVLRYKIGFYEQAKEDFFGLLTMEPTETNVVLYKQNMSVGDRSPMMTTQGGHQSYIYNYLGLTESKLKNYAQAVSYFDSAVKYNPKEPDYFVNRGLAKEYLQDSTAAMDYETALKLNSNHTLARHNLSALKAKKGEPITNEDRITETINADSTMLYPYLERALQRFEAGYFRGAEEDYSNALSIDQSDEEIWLGRGLSREKLKDFEGAFSDYTKAIDLREDFFKAWINRGNVLYKLERYNEAIEDFNVALIYQPDFASAFYNRAMAKMKLKNPVEACLDIKRAEELGMKVEKKVKSKICDE